MTTVIACLALGVSTVSLAWQILSWIQSGARVSVKSARETVYWPPKDRVVVIVTNVGRLATTVHEVAIMLPETRLEDGTLIGSVTMKASPTVRPELPCRLEPGDEMTLRFDEPGLVDFFRLGIEPSSFVPSVRAGRKWTKGRFSAGECRAVFPAEESSE